MHEAMKEAMGIEIANCSTCTHLGQEDDGNYPELVKYRWDVCHEHDSYQNLKSFPFKKEMPCWEPEFWHSKFPDMIETGADEEEDAAIEAFREALETGRSHDKNS